MDGLDWGVLSIEAISCEVLVLIESVDCNFFQKLVMLRKENGMRVTYHQK